MYDFMQNNIRQICLKIYLIFYHDHIKLKLRSYFHMPCKLPTGKKNRNNKRDYNITPNIFSSNYSKTVYYLSNSIQNYFIIIIYSFIFVTFSPVTSIENSVPPHLNAPCLICFCSYILYSLFYLSILFFFFKILRGNIWARLPKHSTTDRTMTFFVCEHRDLNQPLRTQQM